MLVHSNSIYAFPHILPLFSFIATLNSKTLLLFYTSGQLSNSLIHSHIYDFIALFFLFCFVFCHSRCQLQSFTLFFHCCFLFFIQDAISNHLPSVWNKLFSVAFRVHLLVENSLCSFYVHLKYLSICFWVKFCVVQHT